jgi:hypothetical protein
LIQCKDLEIPQINNIVGWKIIPKWIKTYQPVRA